MKTKEEKIRVSRLTALTELKKKFFNSNFSKATNKEIAEDYAEYILEDKTKRVELF